MKKLIQITAILSLLVIFSAVSAQAQTVNRYEANIPFDFNIGQKSYPAGIYVVKTAKLSDSCVSLTVQDKEGNKLQTILVAASGNVSKKQPELVFNRYENQRYLAQLLTHDARISIVMSKDEKRVAKQRREKNSSSQIALAEIK
jgi:hypothetical protein